MYLDFVVKEEEEEGVGVGQEEIVGKDTEGWGSGIEGRVVVGEQVRMEGVGVEEVMEQESIEGDGEEGVERDSKVAAVVVEKFESSPRRSCCDHLRSSAARSQVETVVVDCYCWSEGEGRSIANERKCHER